MPGEDGEIIGKDIDAGAAGKTSGKQIPASAPRVSKVEELSEEEEDEEDDVFRGGAQPAVPRMEVPEGTKESDYRQNALHVYGLDFLKTGHMEEIFSQFNHKYIEWINDSSANIIFSEAASAKRALESLSFPKPDDEPWRRTPDILVSEDVPPIFLQMRLATSKDNKKTRKAVPKAMPPEHYAWTAYHNAYSRGKGGKGKGKGKGPRQAGDPERRAPGAKAKARAAQKRPFIQVTEEEKEKRQKRAGRFGVTEEKTAEGDDSPEDGKNDDGPRPIGAPPPPQPAPPVAPAEPKQAPPAPPKRTVVEVTPEEVERRKVRADRFKEGKETSNDDKAEVSKDGEEATKPQDSTEASK